MFTIHLKNLTYWLLGLTLICQSDMLTAASADENPAKIPSTQTVRDPAVNRDQPANSFTLSGRCYDFVDKSALPGVTVRLYMMLGQTSPPVAVGTRISDAKGEFEFKGLLPPQPDAYLNRLQYAVFALDEFRPIGIGLSRNDGQQKYQIPILREATTVSGRVVDERGKPVAGATVSHYWPIEGFLSSTTAADGKFEIQKMRILRDNDGTASNLHFSIVHPDFPKTQVETKVGSAEVTFTLPTGCIVSGKVIDRATGQPVEAAVVSAERISEFGSTLAATDANGQFRLAVAEGRYNVFAEADDRVCVAVTDQECLAGQMVTVPQLEMTEGGFISGRVINTATGQVVTTSDSGNPITIGLFGAGRPATRGISPTPLAAVDASGHFVVRAAPGETFPYLVNTRGQRMAWDTNKQPAVVVKEGETTVYDMLITPPLPPEAKMKAAQKRIDGLPKPPAERTARIIQEFRMVPNDDTELWCSLMRELVTTGHDAVPSLCDELERTTENRMLRRLGFALRAIGDPRAVPVLIRSIPRTLLPASSDYGLLVADGGLKDFMQKHGLNENQRGMHFGFGRPVREIFGALVKLTGQTFDDAELFGMHLSEDPRRQVLQRRMFIRQAKRWQEWWDVNGSELTDDPAYQKVNLTVDEGELPPISTKLGPNSRLSDGLIGATLSPATQQGQYANHFSDLDTGYDPKWPAHIPRDETQIDRKELDAWAGEKGVDLMCIIHRSAEGTETFALRSLGMKVTEISQRDLRNLDKLLAAGTLPEGRPVDELLMHYDAESNQYVPDANAAFIYVTKEGSMGLIEVTDRVTRIADLVGSPLGPPAGAGFFLGVRFNLRSIIP